MVAKTKTIDLIIRRDCLKLAATPLVGGLSSIMGYQPLLAASSPTPKSIAAVVTIYRRDSHSDVILGKILEGCLH